MKKLLTTLAMLSLGSSVLFAQHNGTATASLSVNVAPEAAIAVNSSPAFTSTGIFGDYTGTTTLTYYVRTLTAGTITVQITTDFSTGGKNGGPSVATPPNAGDALTYSCTAAAPPTGTATGCSTALTASTSAATGVVTFAPNTQSDKAGNSASTSWTLTNDPNYKVGSYTAVATYTISAS